MSNLIYITLANAQQELSTKREALNKRIHHLNSLDLEFRRLGQFGLVLDAIYKLEDEREVLLTEALSTDDALEDSVCGMFVMHADDRITCYLHKGWADQCRDLHQSRTTDFRGQYFIFGDEKRNMAFFNQQVKNREDLTRWLLDLHPAHASSVKMAMTGLTEITQILNTMMDQADADHDQAMRDAMNAKIKGA